MRRLMPSGEQFDLEKKSLLNKIKTEPTIQPGVVEEMAREIESPSRLQGRRSSES